jgi:mono/diheme cytochrome c family protein
MAETQLDLRRGQLIALLLALVVGLFLFEPWSLFSKPIWEQTPSSKSIAEGKQVFATNCAVCHGEMAVGENFHHPMGGMKDQGGYLAPALNGTGHAWHHPDAVLFNTIQEGSIAEDSPMRGFAGRLSDAEIVASIHYFKSLWPKEILNRHKEMVQY